MDGFTVMGTIRGIELDAAVMERVFYGQAGEEVSEIQFRSLPLRGAPQGVDRENRVIRGVSMAQAVEALGHDMLLDSVTIQQIVELTNGRPKGIKSRYTHPGLSSDGLGKYLGRMTDGRVVGDKAVADLHISELASKSPDGDLGSYVMDLAEEDPESFGMSIVAQGYRVWKMKDGREVIARGYEKRPEDAVNEKPILRVTKLRAVDAVDEPAANRDGMFSEALWGTNQVAESAFAQLDELIARYGISSEKAKTFALRYLEARGLLKQGDVQMEEQAVQNGATAPAAPATPAADPARVSELEQKVIGLQAFIEAQQAATEKRLIEAELKASGLSPVSQKAVLKGMTGRKMEELADLIETQREVEAQYNVGTVVNGVNPVGSGRIHGLDSKDKLQIAVDAMFEGRKPKDGIRPLTGLRELYMTLSGDYNMTGHFYPEYVQLANVNSSTMAELVANAMNKRLLFHFQQQDKFWERLVMREDFGNLQEIRWITLGGIGDIPTVNEGAAYQEVTWDDTVETQGWTKKGAYLGLTIEAIDKDDLRKLTMAPRALAVAAWRTLGKAFSSIFTSNSGVGPNMADGNPLFHNNHGNVGTSAFSLAAWRATRLAMQKQTEYHSGERLGGLTAPDFILVPIDLEDTVLEILGSPNNPDEGITTSFEKVNPDAEGNQREQILNAARRKVVKIPFWTDANDWAAMADPNRYPTIGLGFRFGDSPEIFSAADRNSGLMFTNDVMAIKTRWFFSIAPIDYKGVYKHNVT